MFRIIRICLPTFSFFSSFISFFLLFLFSLISLGSLFSFFSLFLLGLFIFRFQFSMMMLIRNFGANLPLRSDLRMKNVFGAAKSKDMNHLPFAAGSVPTLTPFIISFNSLDYFFCILISKSVQNHQRNHSLCPGSWTPHFLRRAVSQEWCLLHKVSQCWTRKMTFSESNPLRSRWTNSCVASADLPKTINTNCSSAH